MTRKLGVGFAVVEELFCGEAAFKCGENVLGSDTVTWAGSARTPAENRRVNIPASSKTTGWNLDEKLKRARSMTSSGTVSKAPPADYER